MAVSKVILNGTTLIDVTDDTVASNNLLSGEQATGADGEKVTGAYVPETYSSQTKTGIVPTESSQTITPDTGYDGLSSVQINGISSTYVGSAIERRDDTDLTASGATVSVPAGYYAENESKSVASGSAATPATAITANPTISVNSSGLITATASATESVTPNVTAGYVSSGTAGNITVSGSATQQLSTQAATTITPTESEQTAVAAGKYTTGIVKVGAISSTYVGSGIERRDETDLTASGATVSVPAGYYSEAESKSVSTATQGTPSVSVNSSTGLVTATATQNAGYVAAGTKSGTLQLTTQAGSTIVPTESSQIAVSAGRYTTGDVTVDAIPSTYIGSGVTQKSAASYTPGTTSQVISSGQYLAGDQTIAGDANLIPANIAEGVEIFGVTGTHSGGGSSAVITETPLPGGGSVLEVQAIDLSQDTVTPETLLSGYTAHDATGTQIVGTASGGGGSSSDNRIRFIDYDGTVVESYTPSEFTELTALPANPTHTGLISQGWNWTLAQIQDYLEDYPDGIVNVGQMYDTASGKTEIDIDLDDPNFLSPYLAIAVNGTATINWGDGSEASTITGTSYTTLKFTQHIYATIGKYTISIDGPIGFYCNGSSYGALLTDTTTLNNRRIYSQNVIAVRISSTARIGNYAFLNCSALQSITIPSSVTSIGDNAFGVCSALQSITIPSGFMSIGNGVFGSCYALQSISIPSSVTSIGGSAFQNCYTLQSITIPSGAQSIGGYTFYECRALQSITIPSGVTSIGGSAFQSCSALQSITIPSGVTSIQSYTFNTCYALQSITIPSGVTSIGNNAFQHCRALQSITIPSTVTSIGTYVFASCTALQSITIPSGVTSIGNNAFQYCYALQSITIPTGVTSIGNNAFQNCYTLQSITIPSDVTNIGTNAFNNCYSVMEYHILPTTPPTLAGTNAFSGIVAGTKIYVPVGSIEAYQTATNWSTYASYMEEESA